MVIRIIKRAVAPQEAAPQEVIPPRREKTVPGAPLDGMCSAAVALAPNTVVPWFLMASYLYYHHDIMLLSDGYYDQLAQDMLMRWGTLTHDHKHLIDVDDLAAGSLFKLRAEDYPLRTRYAARFLVQQEWAIAIEVSHGE